MSMNVVLRAVPALILATAVAAPVRYPVIHVQSMTAYGTHVCTSLRMSSPEMYGRPRARFAGFPPTHFTPADCIPEMYAGMAWANVLAPG